MKKLFFFSILSFGYLHSDAQLNPVKNLNFNQTYQFQNTNCPAYNCFTLSWNVPNSSVDTLKGYNVYRHNVFYKFIPNAGISCPGTAPCSYMDFWDISAAPYWIKVKAVYNKDSVTSVADDSALVAGIMISIKEYSEKIFFTLIPNPLSSQAKLQTSKIFTNATLTIYNSIGQPVKEIRNISGQTIILDRENLPEGLYFLTLSQDNRIYIAERFVIGDN
jgi:hypothetical protein